MATPNDKTHVFQAPKGTRDFYPLELARRRWIEDKWRQTSIRHGFDEIDGPTFEHLDLYTVKSGDGIVSELFSFTREGGDKRYALRPEFTPTLARMAAARANSLPKPTKWFSICPYFRAENPQRGRLREFLQWNVDVIGDDSPEADGECIACCIGFLESLGLTPNDVTIKINNRVDMETILTASKFPEELIEPMLVLLDRRLKITKEQFAEESRKIGATDDHINRIERIHKLTGRSNFLDVLRDTVGDKYPETRPLETTVDFLTKNGLWEWCETDIDTVRGLAYYTGTVFEVHETTGSERAIAGGGRYDKLIELFNGPPTPAVGFAMGDVVLSLVLQDKGLMPTDEQIAQDLGLRPDVYVIPTTETEHLVKTLVAQLRREGLHARHTYKSTRNVGKLLKEANNAHARFALILESDTICTIKDLDSGEQEENVATDKAVARIAPPTTE